MRQADGQEGGHLKFIYSELGIVHATTNRQERLAELAKVITCKQDGRLSRTLVNRLWARFMGHGLVEMVDDMEQPAWNPDLLDWLAEDLVAHHYDVKHTIEVMLTSRVSIAPVNVTRPEAKRLCFYRPRSAAHDGGGIPRCVDDCDRHRLRHCRHRCRANIMAKEKYASKIEREMDLEQSDGQGKSAGGKRLFSQGNQFGGNAG